MRVAALDLGTNTFLCLIAEVEKGQIQKVIDDQVQVVRLGQGVQQSREFHPEALARAKKCLTEFAQNIKAHNVQKVKAVATSAARDVKNGQELFQICKDLDIPLEIISGESEAQMTFAGALSNLPPDEKKRLVVDVGGGSTEFIVGCGRQLIEGLSLDIGCVRLTEKFLPSQPASANEIKSLETYIDQALQNKFHKNYQDVQEILAVAGTPTELAKAEIGKFDPKLIDNHEISEQKMKSWIEKFSTNTPEQITQKFNISNGRADVILVGALILKKTMNQFKHSALKVSTRGIRYGLAQTLALLLLTLVIPFAKAGVEPGLNNKFEKKTISLGAKKIVVEIADTEAKSEQGLMFRKGLEKDHGMLFIFKDEQIRSFWMKNTFIPLSAGFFNAHKKLIDIKDMAPVHSELEISPPTYQSDGPASYVLEMDQGWFKKNNIKTGAVFNFVN